jgi:hypothetical protein
MILCKKSAFLNHIKKHLLILVTFIRELPKRINISSVMLTNFIPGVSILNVGSEARYVVA